MTHEVQAENLSDDDLSRAVLNAMWPIPQLIVTGVVPVTQNQIDNARQRCGELRHWLDAQAISNRVRGVYQKWIEFCECSIVEAEDELRTGNRRREFEEGQQRLRNECQRASAAAATLPKPFRGVRST